MSIIFIKYENTKFNHFLFITYIYQDRLFNNLINNNIFFILRY